MNLRPLNNYVIGHIEKPKEKKIGSIIIPETIAEKQIQKTGILYKSDKCTQVQTGETVISRFGAGTKFMLDGQEYIALDEQRDLICVEEQ